MTLDERPLTDAIVNEVIVFLRTANPFAQITWGWDTGRFMDWRWGSNARRERERPGWFAANGRVFGDASGIRAVVIAESGTGDVCIITRDPEPEIVAEVLHRIEDSPLAADGLHCEISDAADWLRPVFATAGMTESPNRGHEWEYDPAAAGGAAPVPDGFTVRSLADGDPATHRAIADCLAAAFESDGDAVPALVSIEENPMFRPELSVYALSPDGRVASYCRGTVDPGNGVCGIDPVATHPEFQRRGLATAVVRACFRRQAELGGRLSYIGSAADPAPSTILYRSLGPQRKYTFSSWAR
jgi:ribosomal protein S18 acetylase RimI-like enzyme